MSNIWRRSSGLSTSALNGRLVLTYNSIDWSNMTAVHVAGPYYLAVKFIPLFKASNDPSICNITSLATVFLNRYVR